MTSYINHELLKKDALEFRDFQVDLAIQASEKSALVVVPTGLGKTNVALLVILDKLDKGKVLFMAPTRPLVEQHAKFFKRFMTDEGLAEYVHGMTPISERKQVYHEKRIIISTPQTVDADLDRGLIDPMNFSVLIFDECHRAVGDYAYTYVSKKFHKANPSTLNLGLSASPGTEEETIHEICTNLYLESRLIKTRQDDDVIPYIQATPEIIIRVPKDPLVEDSLKRLHRLAQKFYDRLNEAGRPELFRERLGSGTSKSRVINLMQGLQAQSMMAQNVRTAGAVRFSPKTFMVIRDLAGLIKIRHAIELAESQGCWPLYDFLQKLQNDESKAAALITSSDEYKLSMRQLSASMFQPVGETEMTTPKIKTLTRVILEELGRDSTAKILVFCNYRSTVEVVFRHLEKVGNGVVRPARFIGQADGRSNRGMSQQVQRKTVQEFREGKFNLLIATSVGEEGIDIPGCNLVLFHEPPNSAIRHIQRRGRTGRFEAGRCVILVAEKSSDEAYLQMNRRGEKAMQSTLTSSTRQEMIECSSLSGAKR